VISKSELKRLEHQLRRSGSDLAERIVSRLDRLDRNSVYPSWSALGRVEQVAAVREEIAKEEEKK
jgi:hypothetical protein